jgi:hypothetical protein
MKKKVLRLRALGFTRTDRQAIIFTEKGNVYLPKGDCERLLTVMYPFVTKMVKAMSFIPEAK